MKTILQQNKDLDLRRFGKDVYTKAKESSGEGGGDLGKQIAEALVNDAFLKNDESVPSNFVYPDFIANSQYNDDETEIITIIDSIPTLIELLSSNNSHIGYLYKQKPFEVSPYTVTGNESKIYMISVDEAYPTSFYGLEYTVDVNEIEINGETFYIVVEHKLTPPDSPLPGDVS